jgi:hypothetical protein
MDALPKILVTHRFKQRNPPLVQRGNQDKRHFDGQVASRIIRPRLARRKA